MADNGPSYIDYETFLDPDFSPTAFANTLVLSTNNPSDTPLDISTPLSRVLFDVQEIDTHIDTLTTRSSLPLLDYTAENAASSRRVLEGLETQVKTLDDSYKALEREVIERYEKAEEVRRIAERLCEAVRLGRAVSRCLMLGRQLEVQMTEFGPGTATAALTKREDHHAMVRAAKTIVSMRQILVANNPGEEGEGLQRVDAMNTLRDDLMTVAERTIVSRSQQIVREFSMSSLLSSSSGASTYAQTEDTKSRVTSALLALYFLSPIPPGATSANYEPTLLINALQDYLQTGLKSSLAALGRALGQLPTLDRTLLEISARCQNIVALEALLSSIKPPAHPFFSDTKVDSTSARLNMLQPLLQSLDTSSLPSYFWRSLASNLSTRVQEILNRGGVSARTLRTNKDRVRDAIRTCVNRGSQLPAGPLSKGRTIMAGNWEREAAVMIGSIVGVLGR
jgi:hypothetical protein